LVNQVRNFDSSTNMLVDEGTEQIVAQGQSALQRREKSKKDEQKKKKKGPNTGLVISEEQGKVRGRKKLEVRDLYQLYLKKCKKRRKLNKELSEVNADIADLRQKFGMIISRYEALEDEITGPVVGIKDGKRKRIDEIEVKSEKKDEEKEELKRLKMKVDQERKELENLSKFGELMKEGEELFG